MLNAHRNVAALGLVAVLGLLSCATPSLNHRLERWDPASTTAPLRPAAGDEVLLLLAFSGGGTRAAAFAYGVLEELADTWVDLGDGPRRLVDEVDYVSAVSGGSFTAAYFGLYGDRIFEDFEQRVLRRNLQGALVQRLLDPRNWPRLWTGQFNRSELAAEFYDEEIFDGATFGDLLARGGPAIEINATDLSRGNRFPFSPGQLSYLCMDLERMKIGRAVAASTAVPGLLTPIRLRNYAGSCGFEPPAWIAEGLEGDASVRLRSQARIANSYLDADKRRYVHLIDGAVSDNLGIRGLHDSVVSRGGLDRLLDDVGLDRVRSILLILVNAETDPDTELDRGGFIPGISFVLQTSIGIQIRQYNFETIELVRGSFERWAEELNRQGKPFSFHFAEVGFQGLDDPSERRYFNSLPTNLYLSDTAIDRLEDAARRVLRASKGFNDAIAEIGGRVPAGEPGAAGATAP